MGIATAAVIAATAFVAAPASAQPYPTFTVTYSFAGAELGWDGLVEGEAVEVFANVRAVGSSGQPLSEEAFGGSVVVPNVGRGHFRVTVGAFSASNTWARETWLGSGTHEKSTIVEFDGTHDVSVHIEIPRAGVIEGKITSTIAGGSLIGAVVSVSEAGSERHVEAVDYQDVPAGGSYRFDQLAPGSYVVRVYDPSHRHASRFFGGGSSYAAAKHVVVSSGATTRSVDIALGAPMKTQKRVSGSDRYETAAAISRTAYPRGAGVVWVAAGTAWPDALSAGPAAAYQGGPVLLTAPTALSPSAAAEIARLKPQRIVVVGGTGVLSAAVERSLRGFGASVERVGGRDRYETSRLIMTAAFGEYTIRRLVVATGADYADALAGGPLAAYRDAPLLLIPPAEYSVDDATRDALNRETSLESIEVLGGTGVINDYVFLDLIRFMPAYIAHPDRLGGRDRFETSRIIANRLGLNRGAVVATGFDFADAVAGTPLAHQLAVPILLSRPGCLERSTVDLVTSMNTESWTVLGGSGALSDRVLQRKSC